LSQPSVLLSPMKVTTPFTLPHGRPRGLRKSVIPDPLGAVLSSFCVKRATSGRTGILRVFFVFVEYTRHIVPRGVTSISSALSLASSQKGRRPVWIAANKKSFRELSAAW